MTAADIVRGVSADVSAGSVTFNSFAVTPPAGVVNGDQLALFIDTRDAYASWTPPAGWVQRGRPVESSGEGIFYTAKYGTDVTGSSWTFSTGAAAASGKWGWVLVALKGDRVGDYVTGAAQAQSSAGTSSPSPSISPAVPVHLVALAGDRITGSSTWTWPSGWVEQADQQDSTGTNAISQTAAVYDTTPAAAGTYSVTPVHSTTGSIAWSGILAFADASGVAAALSGSGTLSATAGSPAITGAAAALSGSGTLSGIGVRDGVVVDSVAHGGGGTGTSFGAAFVAPTAGQLELVFATVPNTITVTPPAGETWTTNVNVNPDRRMYLFSRVVPPSPTNGAFTQSASSTVSYTQLLISGHDPAAPIADAQGTSSATASTSIVAPTVTSGRDKSLLINHYEQLSAATPPTITPPAGQTTVDSNAVAGASAFATKTATEDWPTAGATGTRTATSTLSQPTGAISVIVQPFIRTAAAALSSTGSLAAAASAPTVSQVAALGGGGTLSAAQTAAVARAAALSGSGSLAAASAPAVARAAALSGSGTLTATQLAAVARAAALGGDGTLTAQTSGYAIAGFSGSGSLTAGQLAAVVRTAALSGTGTLTTTQRLAAARVAAFSGAGTLAAAIRVGFTRAAALSGSGLLTAVPVFRHSAWDGAKWVRVSTRVWTGSAWDDVPVTVTAS